ncbi:MAG: efflux RND transporter permease subunit, partial [Planctomycetota bacterium]
ITLRKHYTGAVTEYVEERVSERIHEELSVLPGLKHISSISKPELSDLTLEFSWNTNIAFATQNIREKLDRTQLPDDVEDPIILRYDPTLDPILRIGVTGGPDADLVALRKLAEDEIQRKLETIEGVAAVKVRGGLEEEIHVEVDKKKLRSLNLNINTLNSRLAAENVNMAAGTIREGDTEYLVRTLNQFMDLDEIMQLVITRSAEGTVRLGSLANVIRTHKEQDIISRINGQESVEIQIFKEAGANIVTLAEKVHARLLGTAEQQAYAKALASGEIPDPSLLLKEMRATKEKEKAEEKAESKELPSGEEERSGGNRQRPHNRGGSSRTAGIYDLEKDPELMKLQMQLEHKKLMLSFISASLDDQIQVRILSDQSRFIQNSINEVKSSGILGGCLAVLILYLFLKKAGSTLIIALSIPISVIATFAPMFMTGTSLNIMSLGGLALGIGMLVDNSIIVLESIFRCREEGDDHVAASIRGVHEIGGAAIASTLTTVAVFFPIAFVEGIAGQIFRDQALTVVFSLLTSLAVALFFIPMLSSRGFGNLAETKRSPYRFTSLTNFRQNKDQMRSRGAAWRWSALPVLFFVFMSHLFIESIGCLLYWTALILIGIVAKLFQILLKCAKYALWPLVFLFDRCFQLVAFIYTPALRYLLTHKIAMVLLFLSIAALFYSSSRLVDDLGQEILPEVHQGELIAHLSLHVGAPLERTDRVISKAEEASLEVEGIDWVSSTVGIARDEISDAEEGEHTAQIFIKINRDGGDIQAKEERILGRLRKIYSTFPEILSCRFSRPTLFSIKAPVQVEVKGIDLAEINAAAREVEAVMSKINGLEDVRSTVQRGSPEVRIRFNREKLSRYNLDTASLATMISDMVKGKVPTRFMSSEHKVDILVRVNEENISSVNELSDLVINPESDAPIPLTAVAEIKVIEGPSEIRRLWGQRAAIVSANLSEFDMGGTAKKIAALIAPIEEKGSLSIDIGGQGRELESAMTNMYLALCLAIFLVYIVMASQFESLFQPFIIICSIPLAFVGVIFTLYWLDIHLSVVVFIGGIMLAGI